ncbi:unnamed protein product, partial [Didymodactylos carnosus]
VEVVENGKNFEMLPNDELKYFTKAAQEFNLKVKPSTTSAVQFWKINQVHLPSLSYLAKIYLGTCGTSVPSESASSSAYLGRKERARLSAEYIAYI